MLRKGLFSLLLSLVSLSFVVSSVFAAPVVESQPAKIYPVQDSGSGIFGQDHAYTITYRGNGEAVVLFRAAITNNAQSNLDSISLKFDNVNISDVTGFQIIKDPQCVRYGNPMSAGIPSCLEYQDPDYFQYWGQAKYQKLKLAFDNGEVRTIRISLPTPIASNKSGSYILYFRVSHAARKDMFGLYKFNFQSLKVDDKVSKVMVGINTDSTDLFLKGGDSSVNYTTTQSAGLAAQKSDESFRSNAFDNIYAQIGLGQIVKSSSNLFPMESYSVKGTYADSQIKLYSREILVGITMFVTLVLVLIFLPVFMSKLPRSIARGGDVFTFSQVVITGIIFSGIIFCFAFLIDGFMNKMTMLVPVRGFLFLGVILSLSVIAFLFLAPSIYFGVKKGIWWGIINAFTTILFFGIFLAISFFYFHGERPDYGIPVPMMKSQPEGVPASP